MTNVSNVEVGQLLVASPALLDPNFRRTVVLVCALEEESGAFGLVLNRASPASVVDVLPAWAEQAAAPALVFLGGPVQPEAAFVLARRRPNDSPSDSADSAAGGNSAGDHERWTEVASGVGLLGLNEDPARIGVQVERLRIFAGYAGWSSVQLEAEIAEGAWFVLPSEPGDAFTEEPEALWGEVVRRQGGALAMFEHFPPSPSVN